MMTNKNEDSPAVITIGYRFETQDHIFNFIKMAVTEV
jgi:hypothetical protein